MSILTKRYGICDVHRLLDYDTTLKPCGYCGMCDAWICQEDLNRWDRRLRAALKRKLERGYKGISDYNEIISKQVEENEREKSSNIISTSVT